MLLVFLLIVKDTVWDINKRSHAQDLLIWRPFVFFTFRPITLQAIAANILDRKRICDYRALLNANELQQGNLSKNCTNPCYETLELSRYNMQVEYCSHIGCIS